MKRIMICLIAMTVFALQAAGFAGSKFQIEETQFDLKASSSRLPTIEGEIRSAKGESLISSARIKIIGLNTDYKDKTTADESGAFKFKNLTAGANYLLTITKEGFDSYKVKIIKALSTRTNTISVYLYKKGKSPKKNCKITGDFGGYDEDWLLDNQYEVYLTGIKTKKSYVFWDWYSSSGFYFDDLLPDTYKIYIASPSGTDSPSGNDFKVKLRKNMSCYVHFDYEMD